MAALQNISDLRSCFENNIFINCPFDKDYKELQISIVFTVKILGFYPQIALANKDSSKLRLDYIYNLVENSKFGIHDLSRSIQKPKSKENTRLNMPFELGIDFGCKMFGDKKADKKILVLEKDRYSYHACISDLSGCDIKHHENEAQSIVKIIRNWLYSECKEKPPRYERIWENFNYFITDIKDEKNIYLDDIPIEELMTYINDWISNSK